MNSAHVKSAISEAILLHSSWCGPFSFQNLDLLEGNRAGW